jgi:hypothetical protein
VGCCKGKLQGGDKVSEAREFPPIKLAIILDEKVVDIIHTDERFAAIWLSNPIVVDVTPEEGEDIAVHLNDEYVDGQFIHTTEG